MYIEVTAQSVLIGVAVLLQAILIGVLIGMPSEPQQQAQGLLDDERFAAALERLELETQRADEAKSLAAAQRERSLREIDAVAAWAWYAREIDEEDEAPE